MMCHDVVCVWGGGGGEVKECGLGSVCVDGTMVCRVRGL